MPTQEKLSSHTAIRDGSILRRVGQLGSARGGLGEWKIQRLTAIALIPLGLYFVVSCLHLVKTDHDTAAAWLARPLNSFVMLMFVAATFVHALAGVRSVFLDYVHGRNRLLIVNILAQMTAIVLSLAAILAILKVFLGFKGTP